MLSISISTSVVLSHELVKIHKVLETYPIW